MSAETDQWRLEQARKELAKFHEVFYDESSSVERRADWAFFTLGCLFSVLNMSDGNVESRMAEDNTGAQR